MEQSFILVDPEGNAISESLDDEDSTNYADKHDDI